MIEPRAKRRALVALLIAALLAGLAFLFMRTVAIDFRGDAQALSLLRQLKEFDTRRDVEALRITTDFETSAIPSDWSALRARALRELGQDPARAAVSDQLSAIRGAMTEKEAAYQALRSAHKATVESRKAADDALAALSVAAGGRVRSPTLASTLAANIERVRTVLRDANIERTGDTARELEARAAALPLAAAAADPLLVEAANRAEALVDAFITARTGETAAWRRFAYTTAGGRIELAAQTASLSIERALDERERWLIYLLTYSAALAIGFSYMGLRSYATLRSLRARNAENEARASQRSRDLAETLRKLKDAEAQLVQSQKMSSMGQLLAGVAHEIQRPLRAVREQLARMRGADPDGRDSRAWESLKGVEEAMELVTKLRNYSRFDQSKVAGFNVNDGVQATLLIARPLLRRVEVEKSLGDVPAITCSPILVNQVLLNLVTNAAQAIDKPGGRITVTTRPAQDAIAIDVADNGRGIASDALPRIFDPFFSPKDSGTGAGLGLSTAHRIVAQLGGRIEVRSQLGAGSTFTVTLPTQPPQEAIPTESNRSVHA